jgi:hypothetical protein
MRLKVEEIPMPATSAVSPNERAEPLKTLECGHCAVFLKASQYISRLISRSVKRNYGMVY